MKKFELFIDESDRFIEVKIVTGVDRSTLFVTIDNTTVVFNIPAVNIECVTLSGNGSLEIATPNGVLLGTPFGKRKTNEFPDIMSLTYIWDTKK